MKKSASILFIIVILLMCAAPILLALAGFNSPGAVKQALASPPRLMTAEGQLNRQFTTELDSYIAGNFPLRTWLITAWHHLNILILGQTGNEQVILGRDGWLFYAPTVPAYLGQDRFSPAEYARLDTMLHLQSAYLARRGIDLLYTVVPNKNTVYPTQMPRRYSDGTADNALAGLADSLSTPGYVDLRQLLIMAAAEQEKPLYHQTDSHWNNRGALLACEKLLEQAGTLLGQSLQTPYATAGVSERTDWTGDLGLLLYPSGPSPDIQQHYDVRQGYRYARPLRSLEDLLITTRGDGNLSLLMFRDSFANALIPMLSETFANATYSRAVPYDYSLIDDTLPDLVLLEIVERNLADWLSNAPRMPSSVYEGTSPEVASMVSGQLSVETTEDAGWLKISGRLTADRLTEDWTRVLVRIGDDLFEAFPVTDKQQPATASFVLYLASGDWTGQTAVSEVLVETGSGWLAQPNGG